VVNSGKKGGPGHYPPVEAPPNHNTYFKITIEDGNGITFSKDPIWIQEGTAKPLKHVIDPQISKIRGQDTTELTFRDANSGGQKTLTYVLNFNSGAPQLDPIIQNGGGGPPLWTAKDYILYGGGTVLILALGAYIARRIFIKWRAKPIKPVGTSGN
jgi:hypothetical protein